LALLLCAAAFGSRWTWRAPAGLLNRGAHVVPSSAASETSAPAFPACCTAGLAPVALPWRAPAPAPLLLCAATFESRRARRGFAGTLLCTAHVVPFAAEACAPKAFAAGARCATTAGPAVYPKRHRQRSLAEVPEGRSWAGHRATSVSHSPVLRHASNLRSRCASTREQLYLWLSRPFLDCWRFVRMLGNKSEEGGL